MGNLDEMKGHLEEAAGDATDDEDLERRGQIDQATGKVKDAVGDIAESVKDKVTRD